MENTNILELRADCIKKQSYLLLSNILNYYNIPVRKSSEKILEACLHKDKRILSLSYKKESKGNSKKILYLVNVILEGQISKNILTDNKNGVRYELFSIKEFSVVINGEVQDTSYSLLQKLNKDTINNINKPLNLGKINFYNQEIWNYNKCLSPMRDGNTIKTDMKILKDFIPKIITELDYNLKDETIQSIDVDYFISTIKGIYYMVANVSFSNDMLISFFFKSAEKLTYYTESVSTEGIIWIYLDRVKICKKSEVYTSRYDTISEFMMIPGCNGHFDFNEKFYASVKKYFK